jgi:YesN/AraC family two-component response regulator
MSDKVLVIDDERPTLKMFTLLLSAYGYEVLTAENGREGVETFRREGPELVLTDIKMPVMDGIEALKAIKKLNPATEVLNLDATDFINKPLKREALEKALTRAKERMTIARNAEGQVVLEEKNRAAVIGVRGNVSAMTMPRLAEAFEQAVAMDKEAVLIEFEKNASINGAGITGLTELLRDNAGSGTRIYLAGLSSNFRSVFETLGITRYAELFDREAGDLTGD